jgi:aminomethyltransferase
MKKADFIGRSVLERQKAEGLKRVLIGFEIEGNRYARHGQPLLHGGKEVGFVTSGGFCPSLKRGMGLGYAPPELAALGTELAADVRGTQVPVRVVERPFWKHGSHK